MATPTAPKNIRVHREWILPVKAPTAPSAHQNQPEHTEKQPGKHPPVRINAHWPAVALQPPVHTGSTRSPPPVKAHPSGHEHLPMQSAQLPHKDPGNPKENLEHPNDKSTKTVNMQGRDKSKLILRKYYYMTIS